MASGGGKAGKAAGEGHGAGRAGGEGHQVCWLARDVRETNQGSQGKPAGQPRSRKLPDCKNCADLCCGLSRALVLEAFELGAISMSCKVSLNHY